MCFRHLFFLLVLLAPLRALAIIPQNPAVHHGVQRAHNGVPDVITHHLTYGRGRGYVAPANHVVPKKFSLPRELRPLGARGIVAMAGVRPPARDSAAAPAWPMAFLALVWLLLYEHRARGQLRAGWPRQWPIRPPPAESL